MPRVRVSTPLVKNCTAAMEPGSITLPLAASAASASALAEGGAQRPLRRDLIARGQLAADIAADAGIVIVFVAARQAQQPLRREPGRQVDIAGFHGAAGARCVGRTLAMQGGRAAVQIAGRLAGALGIGLEAVL